LQPAQKNSVGDGQQSSLRAATLIETDLISDFFPESDSPFKRHPPGGRTCREATWFQQQDLARPGKSSVQEGWRDTCSFSGARGGLQHNAGRTL